MAKILIGKVNYNGQIHGLETVPLSQMTIEDIHCEFNTYYIISEDNRLEGF